MNIPVVLIVFNRPSLTQRVFNAIKEVKPPQLFIISDGPRTAKGEDEIQKVLETRKIIETVDWKCEVFKKYSKTNLGCRRSVSEGLDWVFRHVEQAIILEDDCVPDLSFFPYCEELLSKYKQDNRVMHITGTNLLTNKKATSDSYFFTHHVSVWGWATWKRAWKYYDVEMKGYENEAKTILTKILVNPRMINAMQKRLDSVVSGKLDTWDYQWAYAIWKRKAIGIMPNNNLISNIGFGKDATHTKQGGIYDQMKTKSIDIPLKHPAKIITNETADKILSTNLLPEKILLHYISYFVTSIMRFLSTFAGTPTTIE